MIAQLMPQNLLIVSGPVGIFCVLRHPNHFVLAGANNRNVVVVSKTKHSKTNTEARSTQISKTKHPKLENEAPLIENEAPYLENEAPKTRKLRPLNVENEAP